MVDCFTVFLSVFALLLGLSGLWYDIEKKATEPIFYISVLFSFNYWQCFYSVKQYSRQLNEN